MTTVKELKGLNVGEKVDSIELFFDGTGDLKTAKGSGNKYQTVTFKDASGDKIKSTIFGITADKDWKKVPAGSTVVIKNFIIGSYAPEGRTAENRIDDAKFDIKTTTVAPIQTGVSTGGSTHKTSKEPITGSQLVSEREKHDYYVNKDQVIMRQTALNAATAFWTSPNLVSVFGDKLKQGLLDPLVVLTTAMFYYAWLGNDVHPEVNERLAELLTLEEVTFKSGQPSLPVDELIVRFIQPNEILKSVRETILALAKTEEKKTKTKETKDAEKNTPTE